MLGLLIFVRLPYTSFFLGFIPSPVRKNKDVASIRFRPWRALGSIINKYIHSCCFGKHVLFFFSLSPMSVEPRSSMQIHAKILRLVIPHKHTTRSSTPFYLSVSSWAQSIDTQALQPELGSNHLHRLPDLQHSPRLPDPVPTQPLRPAFQSIHLPRRAIQVPFL